LAIWGFHQGFQGLGQDFSSPTRWDRFPLHSRVVATLLPCQEVPHVLVLPDLLF
jgi:hypothetical protein